MNTLVEAVDPPSGDLSPISLSDTVRPAYRVFKTRDFGRWLRKSPLNDVVLCQSVREMAAGSIDANLGGYLLKKRIALPGRGRRSGARVVVATNLENRWFFLLGFQKNERESIEPRELVTLQKVATLLVKYRSEDLLKALERGELMEICHET